MSETVVVTGASSEEGTAAPPSVERVIGQLETETEHLAGQTQEATETAEAAESTAETAVSIASNATETAWDARMAVDTLRGEMTAGFEALAVEIANLRDEDLEDHESQGVEIANDAPAAEPVSAEETAAPKTSGILRRIVYGR